MYMTDKEIEAILEADWLNLLKSSQQTIIFDFENMKLNIYDFILSCFSDAV